MHTGICSGHGQAQIVGGRPRELRRLCSRRDAQGKLRAAQMRKIYDRWSCLCRGSALLIQPAQVDTCTVQAG